MIPLKSGQYLSQLGELNLNNNRIKTLSPYCEPYFSVLESGAFKLRLRNMSLECNSCFLWVKLCPYNIIFADGDSPTCSGPELLGGEYLVNITAEELAVTPCKGRYHIHSHQSNYKILKIYTVTERFCYLLLVINIMFI